MDIAFLCNRLRILEEDDLKNLVRVIRYIRGTLHLPLILSSDILSVIKWWVDTSFTAHPYCKGNTRVMMSMVSGSIMDLSQKQKINGRSSKEAKIVRADDALPQWLLLRNFIEGQGYAVEKLDFLQDNMSCSNTRDRRRFLWKVYRSSVWALWINRYLVDSNLWSLV